MSYRGTKFDPRRVPLQPVRVNQKHPLANKLISAIIPGSGSGLSDLSGCGNHAMFTPGSAVQNSIGPTIIGPGSLIPPQCAWQWSNPAMPVITGNFTFFWMNVEDSSVAPTYGTQVSSRQPVDMGFDMGFNATVGPGNMHGDVGDGTDWISTNIDGSTPQMVDFVLQSYAVTIQAGVAAYVYFNGIDIGSQGLGGGVPVLWDSNHLLVLGNDTGYGLHGTVPFVGIWNRALAHDEIASLHNAPFSMFRPLVPKRSFKPTTITSATGTIGATAKKPTATIAAKLTDFGTITATAKKPVANLTNLTSNTGTIGATAKKPTASINGNLGTPTTVVLTSGTSWTVPSGVNILTSVETWGPGGGGYLAGGGGGAYAAIKNLAVTSGSSITMQIGTGGGGAVPTPTSDGSGTTWFKDTSTVLADYGRGGGDGASAGAACYGTPGLAANSIGTTKFDGGIGGYGPLSVAGQGTAFGGGGGSASKLAAGSQGDSDYTQPSGPAVVANGGAGGGGTFGAGGTGNLNSTSPASNGGNGGANVEAGGGGAPGSYNDGSANGGNGGAPGGGGGGAPNISGNGARGQIRIVYLLPNETGTIAATAKKPTATIAAKLTDFGTIGATAKKPTATIAANLTDFGTIAATAKKPTATVTAKVNETGTITATAKKPTATVAASVIFSGTIAATAKKPTANIAAKLTDFGTITATAKKPTATIASTFVPPNETGTIGATAKKPTSTISGNVTTPGQYISATIRKPIATLNGGVIPLDSGTITATAKKPTATIAAKLTDFGTITATAKKPTATVTANVGERATLTATAKKPTANIAAKLTDSGTITATTKKPTANIVGHLGVTLDVNRPLIIRVY